MSNDLLTPFAKTSDYMSAALERMGIAAYVRDNADSRLLTYVFSEQMEDGIPGATRCIDETYRDLVRFAGIDTVLSLDLNWLVAPGIFVNDPHIRSIRSYWFDDFRSCCTSANQTTFPISGNDFQAHIKHPKVLHHFYGSSQAQEASLLGVHNQTVTRLAAGRELLESNGECENYDRLAFIGNPGFRGTPHQEAVKMMENGAELSELRKFSRESILRYHDVSARNWFKEEPTLLKLLAVALEARRQFPYQPAMQIVQLAGNHYPRAFDYINERGLALNIAFFVKLVNRYDRPAFIYRLYQRGWLDVFSAAEEWAPYGIQAKPYISFAQLPTVYRRFVAQVNAPNSIRDATANEKLFEIAASGRLSINLDSPDVRSCYNEGEVSFVSSLAELETRVEQILKDPGRSFSPRRPGAAENRKRTLVGTSNGGNFWTSILGKAVVVCQKKASG